MLVDIKDILYLLLLITCLTVYSEMQDNEIAKAVGTQCLFYPM